MEHHVLCARGQSAFPELPLGLTGAGPDHLRARSRSEELRCGSSLTPVSPSPGHSRARAIPDHHHGLLPGRHGLYPHVRRHQRGVLQRRAGLVSPCARPQTVFGAPGGPGWRREQYWILRPAVSLELLLGSTGSN